MDMLYPSEDELKAIEQRLVDVGVYPTNLEAEIDGAFIFEAKDDTAFVVMRAERAGFICSVLGPTAERTHEFRIQDASVASAPDVENRESVVAHELPDTTFMDILRHRLASPPTVLPASAPEAGDVLPAIRKRSEATHLDYPHSRAVSDVEIMLREYDALAARLREAEAALENNRVHSDALVGILETVERNLPQQQPINMGIPLGAANYSQVYSAWYAGEIIRKALAKEQRAAQGGGE